MTVSAILKTIHSIPHQQSIEAYALNNQLDLTVVTPRVLVCSEPVDGRFPQRLFKNALTDVLEYLNEHHRGNWLIFNLQAEKSKYKDCQVFGNVEHYPFPDHQPPPFSMLVRIINSIESYLAANPDHVVVIHCKAGKGRTGTVVCSYLMRRYGLTAEQANKFYSEKRMRMHWFNEGVSIKSQKRYLKYFECWLAADGAREFIGKKLMITGIRIKSVRQLQSNTETLVVTLYDYYGNNVREVCNTFEINKIDKNTVEYKPDMKFAIGPDIRVCVGRSDGVERWFMKEHCSFWINGGFESWKKMKLGETVNRAQTVAIKYEETDGIRGMAIKPGFKLFDVIELDYLYQVR